MMAYGSMTLQLKKYCKQLKLSSSSVFRFLWRQPIAWAMSSLSLYVEVTKKGDRWTLTVCLFFANMKLDLGEKENKTKQPKKKVKTAAWLYEHCQSMRLVISVITLSVNKLHGSPMPLWIWVEENSNSEQQRARNIYFHRYVSPRT